MKNKMASNYFTCIVPVNALEYIFFYSGLYWATLFCYFWWYLEWRRWKLTKKNGNPENEDSYIRPDSVFRPLDLARFQSNDFSVEINISKSQSCIYQVPNDGCHKFILSHWIEHWSWIISLAKKVKISHLWLLFICCYW